MKPGKPDGPMMLPITISLEPLAAESSSVQQLSSVSDHREAPHEQLEVKYLSDGHACSGY